MSSTLHTVFFPVPSSGINLHTGLEVGEDMTLTVTQWQSQQTSQSVSSPRSEGPPPSTQPQLRQSIVLKGNFSYGNISINMKPSKAETFILGLIPGDKKLFEDRSFYPFYDSCYLQFKFVSVSYLAIGNIKYLCSFGQPIVSDKFISHLENFDFFLLTGSLNIMVLLYLHKLLRMKRFSNRSFYPSNPDKDSLSTAIDDESVLKMRVLLKN